MILSEHPTTLYDLAGGRPAIERLVRTFYARVREHPRLGPVFAIASSSDAAWWARHEAKLVDFWVSVAGGPPLYHGRPAPAHEGFGIVAAHFDEWLALWARTLRDTLPPDAAANFLARATRMRAHLERYLEDAEGFGAS